MTRTFTARNRKGGPKAALSSCRSGVCRDGRGPKPKTSVAALIEYQYEIIGIREAKLPAQLTPGQAPQKLRRSMLTGRPGNAAVPSFSARRSLSFPVRKD